MVSAYTSLLVFGIITLIYFITKYYYLTKKFENFKLIVGIYIIGTILSQFMINIGLINSICGNSNYGSAFLVTIIPWGLIFGLLYGSLTMFPGWKAPFSNTIGYIITRIGGIRTLLVDNILKQKNNDKNLNSSMMKALNHIYSDPSLLINEITPNNFSNFWQSMKNSGLLKSNVTEISKTKLRNLVILKDIISEFLWYILTGFLITSFSYNQVISQGCQTSVAEMKRRHEDYEKQVKKDEDEKQKTPSRRVYYSNN